jgi:hypothetical protein
MAPSFDENAPHACVLKTNTPLSERNRNMNLMRLPFLRIHALFLVTLLFDLCCQGCQTWVTTIPPKCNTEGVLILSFVRIQDFWNEHGKVPRMPDELPQLKDRDCSLKDGWGREVIWEWDGQNTVTVRSFGRDGKAGGTGEDADMEIVFVGRQPRQDDLADVKKGDLRP